MRAMHTKEEQLVPKMIQKAGAKRPVDREFKGFLNTGKTKGGKQREELLRKTKAKDKFPCEIGKQSLPSKDNLQLHRANKLGI